jgi:hypothetical protein
LKEKKIISPICFPRFIYQSADYNLSILVTQTSPKSQVRPPPSLPKVMRSYQVVLKCTNQTQREEINQRIRRLEERQKQLLTPKVIKTAIDLYRTNPKEKFKKKRKGLKR